MGIYKINTKLCFISLIVIFSILNCKKKEMNKKIIDRSVRVQVQLAKKKLLKPYIEATGTLNPNDTVTVSAEIDGILKSVNADEGTLVSKETLLGEINPVDYKLSVDQAEVILQQAKAKLENDKIEYSREKTLLYSNATTRQKYDQVKTQYITSKYEVEKARVALEIAREKLSKTKIFSPLNGVVKSKKVSAGNYVRNGTELFTILDNNPLKLNFNISEKDISLISIGQNVVFKVSAYPKKDFHAQVSVIYPNLDEKTRTVQVEALTRNPYGILKPGFFAKVILYLGDPRNIIVVPITSLTYEDNLVKLFTIQGKTAKERFVKVGNKYDEVIEITEGLKENEKIVIVGQQNLSDGVVVKIDPQNDLIKPRD